MRSIKNSRWIRRALIFFQPLDNVYVTAYVVSFWFLIAGLLPCAAAVNAPGSQGHFFSSRSHFRRAKLPPLEAAQVNSMLSGNRSGLVLKWSKSNIHWSKSKYPYSAHPMQYCKVLVFYGHFACHTRVLIPLIPSSVCKRAKLNRFAFWRVNVLTIDKG